MTKARTATPLSAALLGIALGLAMTTAARTTASAAGPQSYVGGLVRLELTGDGDQTVEAGPFVNETDGDIGGILVVTRPGQEAGTVVSGTVVRGIEVIDAKGTVVAGYRFDDDGDGIIQAGEGDAMDDEKHAAVGLSIGVGASLRETEAFRLRIAVTARAGAEVLWQAARGGKTPATAGPLVTPVAEVNRGSGRQKAVHWAASGRTWLEIWGRNADPADGLVALTFEAPEGTTILQVTSGGGQAGTWDPGTRTFRFEAPVPVAKAFHLALEVSLPSQAVVEFVWTPDYPPSKAAPSQVPPSQAPPSQD